MMTKPSTLAKVVAATGVAGAAVLAGAGPVGATTVGTTTVTPSTNLADGQSVAVKWDTGEPGYAFSIPVTEPVQECVSSRSGLKCVLVGTVLYTGDPYQSTWDVVYSGTATVKEAPGGISCRGKYLVGNVIHSNSCYIQVLGPNPLVSTPRNITFKAPK